MSDGRDTMENEKTAIFIDGAFFIKRTPGAFDIYWTF